MKTKLCIWIVLISFTAGAATLTINIPANDVQRVAAAYGNLLNLTNPDGTRRSATVQEVTDFIRFEMIAVTYGYEGRRAFSLVSPTPLEMQPTPTPTPTATPTSTP